MKFGRMLTYQELYGDVIELRPDVPMPKDAGDTDLPATGDRRTSWSASELLTIDFPEPRWAVPGLVAEGVNLLAGAPKLGKSWLALGLGIAVASGGKALGRIDVDQGDVLYLALEDTGRRLQHRLRTVLGGDPAPERLRLATECEPMAAGGAERITAWLDRYDETRLVIIDVFTKIRPTASDRADRYAADYAAMSTIKALADRYGVAFVVVHHTRKMAADDFLDAVNGTQGLAGASDAVLVLTRSRGSSDATLKVTGRDIEEADHALQFVADLGSWHLLDGPAADWELGDTRRVVLQLLREREAMTPKAVADEIEIAHETVKKTMRRMADDGQLGTDGNGLYFAPRDPVSTVPPVPPSPPSLLPGDTGT